MGSDHFSDNIKVFSSLNLFLVISTYWVYYKLVHVMLVHFCFCFINFIQLLFDDMEGLLLLFVKVRGPNYFNFILDYSIWWAEDWLQESYRPV